MSSLKKWIDVVRDNIKKLNRGSFFHIFGSNVWSLGLSFLTSVIVVRQLDKTLYGSYTVANNLYNYFALFMGLGLTNSVMQFCSEKRSEPEKKAIYRFSLVLGTGFSTFLSVAIVATALVGINPKPEVNRMLLAMCGIPIVAFFEAFFKSYIRVKRYNKLFAYANMIGSAAHFVVAVIATEIFSVYGYIVTTYLQYIILIVYYMLAFRFGKDTEVDFLGSETVKMERPIRNEIVKYALLCCITNATSTLLSLLDITCLDRILNDSNIIASYKVGILIPNALMFIPSSYLIFIYPYLAGNNDSPLKLKKYVDRSLGLLAGINFAVCAVLFFGAGLVVKFLWGDRFSDAVPVFRVLVVNYFISGTFRKLYGNVIVCIKKVSVNLFNTAFAGVLNIILNIVLIRNFNSIGAAWATLLTSIVTSGIAYFYYIIWHRKQMKKAL